MPVGGPVLTATLVDPRVTPWSSSKRTKMRLWAASNGISPLPVTNTAKTPTPSEPNWRVTVGAGGDRHCAVATFATQMLVMSGTFAVPVSAETVRIAVAPTFAVATANAVTPSGPGTSTMPAPPVVAPTAMTSGPGTGVADRRSVLTPMSTGAG